MSRTSLALSFSVLYSFTILLLPLIVSAATPGKVRLYDDWSCQKPSTINPEVSLTLDTCLVTTNGYGLVIAELPPCSEGTAVMLYYSDVACQLPTENAGPSPFDDKCISLAAGANIFDAKSAMFSCKAAEDNPQPTATTTALVSGIAPVATGSADGSGSSSGVIASSKPTSATSANPASTGHSTESSSTDSGGGSGSAAKTNTESGLSTSDIVAIAVGLGIGVPTILIMLLAWLWPDARKWFLRCCCGGRKETEFRQDKAQYGYPHHAGWTYQR